MGTLDWAGDKLRKETDKGKEGNDVFCGLKSFTIDINSITQGLKRIKTDSDRKTDTQCRKMRLKSEGFEKYSSRVNKEVEILEKAKKTEVDDQACP